MVNPQIVDYIRTQLRQGATKNSVTTSMIAGGWNPTDVEAAFAEASREFQPASKTSESYTPVVHKDVKHIVWQVIKVIILLIIIFLCVLFWIGEAPPPRL